MDYFFQEQRWTDTFLSLHVKKFKRIILFLLIAFSATGAKAQSDVKFNDGVRYSQWVIDSRMNNFYANTTKCGFAVYNQEGTQTSPRVGEKTTLDYVVGLVAKSIIEASQYYSQYTWAQSFAKPWFLSIKDYGDNFYNKFKTIGGSLDDLNAVKLFIPLRALTETKGKYPDATTFEHTTTALNTALTGLGTHNTKYSIGSETLAETAGNIVAGGWWHKSDYQNQMWLDGSYMGPALFAQLVNYSNKITNIDATNDWNLIVKQFTILRNMCWDNTDKLLYHAFAADGGKNSTSHSDTWEGLSSIPTYCFHSASYWGRAVGWYFLALVDVLEQMDNANLSSSEGYTTLKRYLEETADGIKNRQDQATGGWYQILDKNNEFSASSYNNGKSHTTTYNYIESSATALFTAAYLKAIRLGYLAENDYKTVAVNGYKCLVNNFFSVDENGKVNIFGSCRSAGLGGKGDEYKEGKIKYRNGSKEYYLLGYDVAKVEKTENKTEGKVLGAFIMAATEYERLYQPSTLLSKDLNETYNLSSNKSLTVEVLGDGKPEYQWYNATESTPSAITGANDASYTPTQNGKYYCEIKVTPTSADAKTRTASTSGSYTIKTSIADVYVAAAATTYTVTFNAGTYGTCSESPKQVSAGENITLPSVTANSGYTFDGWYDAATDGTKIGDADQTYTPESNITLYAHYTATGGSGTEQTTTIDFDNKDNTNFTLSGGKWSGSGSSAYYGLSSAKTFTIASNKAGVSITKIELKYTADNSDRYGGTIKVSPGSYSYSSAKVMGTWTGNASSVSFTTTNKARISYIKVYYSSGPSISFTTQPTAVNCVQGASASLSVVAVVNNDTNSEYGGVTYQWYSNKIESNQNGTLLEGKTEATLTPSTSNLGTDYYYCVATATKTADPTKKLTATSNVVALTVSAPTITISKQPENATYGQNQTTGVEPLTVLATTNSGNDITYQWYSKDTENAETGTKIEEATSAEYLPPVDKVGTKYYYCEVTSGSLTINTDIVAITVNNDQPIYKYQVSKAGLTAPSINSSKYITTKNDETGETGEKLVKMTFGGWKWNEGKYIKPGGTNEITDSWTDSETEEAAVTALDGFKYWFRGTQDAAHEKKDSVMTMYGQKRYGWFVSPTREDGITTVSHPYTLPVRGSFMTFEPTKNGTLTIYILQNGVWNSDKDKNIDIIPGEFRMHAFQITNQRGLVLAEFAPKYSVTNNQMVKEGYKCTNYEKQPASFNNQSKDVSDWEEFWTLSYNERKAVHDSWSDAANNTPQKIIKLDNGSFLAIQKAVVKYQFHVTGNETYYFFSNFSKMGFSGATFQPDADSGQPTDVATFSGDNSLDDTKAYTQIEKVEDGKIGDTGLTNYKYTIGGKEVGKVTGVFIPQFKAITLKRTFKPKQWTTLSLPFNLTQTEVEQIFGKGTQIIVFDKAKITSARTYLTFFYHEIQNVLPGYPYLIRPTLEYADGSNNSNSADYAPRYTIDEYGNLTEFTVYNKAINPHITQHEFKSDGYTAKCTPSYCTANEYYNNINYSKRYKEGDIFVSEGNGTVYISGGQSYGKGYRSYIDYTGTTTPAKALSISFSGVEDDDDNGTTTDIRIAELADDVIQTLGIGGVYNLNGQKVADTTRNLPAGIYIVNGRKVVVK